MSDSEHEAKLRNEIQRHRNEIEKAEKELEKIGKGTKGMVTLLTGEQVPEFNANHVVGPVTSHCPGKWVMLDMECGDFYAWDIVRKTWVSPPDKVKEILATMLYDNFRIKL